MCLAKFHEIVDVLTRHQGGKLEEQKNQNPLTTEDLKGLKTQVAECIKIFESQKGCFEKYLDLKMDENKKDVIERVTEKVSSLKKDQQSEEQSQKDRIENVLNDVSSLKREQAKATAKIAKIQKESAEKLDAMKVSFDNLSQSITEGVSAQLAASLEDCLSRRLETILERKFEDRIISAVDKEMNRSRKRLRTHFQS